MGVEGEEGEEEVLAVVSRLHLTDCQPLSVCVGVCNIVCVYVCVYVCSVYVFVCTMAASVLRSTTRTGELKTSATNSHDLTSRSKSPSILYPVPLGRGRDMERSTTLV